jgi:hypothetical protein
MQFASFMIKIQIVIAFILRVHILKIEHNKQDFKGQLNIFKKGTPSRMPAF